MQIRLVCDDSKKGVKNENTFSDLKIFRSYSCVSVKIKKNIVVLYHKNYITRNRWIPFRQDEEMNIIPK